MEHLVPPILPVFVLSVCMIGLAVGMLTLARIVRPGRPGRVTRMPYESGMDPIHDTRRRFDVRFYLLAIAFLVFDVELLFLYPWAVASGQRAISSGQSAVGSRKSAVEDSRGGERERGRVGDDDLQGSPPLPLSPSATLSDSPSAEAAVSVANNHHLIFAGIMTFVGLLTLGYVYDWRKGVFQWR